MRYGQRFIVTQARFRRMEDGDPAGGGGGGDDEKKALQRLQSWMEEQTSGLRGNRDAIRAEKDELQEKFNTLKKDLDGLPDLKTVKALLSKFQTDKEAQLLSEGKIDEVLQLRTDAMRRDYEARVAAADKSNDELKNLLSQRGERILELSVDNQVRSHAPEGMVASAVVDAVREARGIWQLDEESGDLVARHPDGTPMFGKDGKSPLSVQEWMEGDPERNPHRYGRSAGGGANGGGDPQNRDRNPEKVEGMTPRQKLTVALGGGPS